MKNRITLFLTCLLCFNLFGQTPFKDLDIKQFQYADAQIRTFDLGLNQVSQFSYYDYGQDIQSTNNNFRFNGSFVTRQYKNSRKIQHSRALFGDFSTQKFNSGEESRPWAIRGNVGFNTQSRFYKENKFLEISPDFNLSIVKDDNLEFNGAVALKKGRGRIEPVSDVYMVRWMLKDLEDNGVNLSDWSQDDVFEIANRLNVINNYRIFDGRRQLKTQVKDISMAIESKGKGTLEPFDLYGIVFDNYTRAFIGSRFEGSRRAFVARPTFKNRNTISTQKNSTFAYGLELFGEYTRSKNTSLNTQHGLEFQGGVGFLGNSEPDYKYFYPFVQGKYQFDWYPNSRSSLSWFAQAQYRYENYKLLSDVFNRSSQSTVFGNAGFTTNYFISFRTRIQATFGVNYNDINLINVSNGRRKNFNFNNNISFLHSIF